MLHEHYLDFSYAPVVHRDDVPPGLDRLPAFHDVEVTETTVSYTRLLPEAPLAKWEADATGLDTARGYSRRESGVFASPAMQIQRWEIEADGAKYSNVRTHAITPETAASTHVFMQASRNYVLERDSVTTVLQAFVDELIRRDTTIVEAAASRVGYDGWQSHATPGCLASMQPVLVWHHYGVHRGRPWQLGYRGWVGLRGAES